MPARSNPGNITPIFDGNVLDKFLLIYVETFCDKSLEVFRYDKNTFYVLKGAGFPAGMTAIKESFRLHNTCINFSEKIPDADQLIF